jgi:hypothetical protein
MGKTEGDTLPCIEAIDLRLTVFNIEILVCKNQDFFIGIVVEFMSSNR